MNSGTPGHGDGADRTAHLQVDNVSVRLGDHLALGGVDLALAEGELGCLLGASGCGKTTLLRAIAGLQPIDTGRITLAGRLLSGNGRAVAPEKRGIGLVFQDLALFPHLDVAANIAFGLPGKDRKQVRTRVADLIARLHLEGLQGRYPHELSGGQQQRVAIARSLAPEPALLLLDEPFSSLDAGLRKQLRAQLRELLRQLGSTAILVTHDQEEAMAFADRVAVMRQGLIEQYDTPWQVYHQPASPYVAGFVGEGALIPAHRGADGWHSALGPVPASLAGHIAGDRARLLVRPDDLLPDPDSRLRGRVDAVEFRGAQMLVSLSLADGQRVPALWSSHVPIKVGGQAGLHWQPPHLVLFQAH